MLPVSNLPCLQQISLLGVYPFYVFNVSFHVRSFVYCGFMLFSLYLTLCSLCKTQERINTLHTKAIILLWLLMGPQHHNRVLWFHK